MPISPPLLLILVLSALYAALFHLVWGKGLRQLSLFWLVATAGFVVGDILAAAAGFSFIKIGVVNLGAGTVAAWAAMFVVRQFAV